MYILIKIDWLDVGKEYLFNRNVRDMFDLKNV